MRRLTYPDGEMLTYEYDSGGLLSSAIGVTTSGKTAYIKSMLYDEYGSRTSITYGNATVSTYTYDEDMHRLTGLKTISSASKVLQNISYEYDDAGNILSRTNSGYVTTDTTTKNATQTYGYDDLHRLVSSTGKINTGSLLGSETNNYTNTFAYDSIGNITQKAQAINALDSSNNLVKVEDKTYDWSYTYGGQRPHAVTAAGSKTFSYDPNGNMTKSVDSTTSTTRSLTWDDKNRLTKVVDSGTNNTSTTFAYDAGGVRAIKSGNSGDVIYVNGTYSVRNSEIYSKHVFAGNTRVATRMFTVETEDGNTTTTDNGAFFYHGDHLGSSSVITDSGGKFYEHIEYFPYGEDWVDEKGTSTSESVPYKFTGKEYDSETGLYYFGPRYYDAVRAGWDSPDKYLADGKYFPDANDYDTEHDYYWYLSQDASKKLPGVGGVFNSVNLNPYCYAGNNPVKYTDPDGHAFVSFNITNNPLIKLATNLRENFPDSTLASLAAGLLEGMATDVMPVAGITSTSNSTKSLFRYVGEKEKDIITKTGKVPNVDAKGNLKEIFLTDKKYSTAGKAKTHLQLPNKPKYGVEIDPKNVKDPSQLTKVKPKDNPQWGIGGGNETKTSESIPVDTNKIFKLKGNK